MDHAARPLRVLARASMIYVRADLDWRHAAETAVALFPPGSHPGRAPIGDPRSRMRRLWEARERALLRVVALREGLARSRARPDPATDMHVILRLPPA